METGVCDCVVGLGRFWSVWHVYCLGDLGQWSTSGTSHNRVHTSAALRHPTRRAGRKREREREARARKHLGSFFAFPSLSKMHTHTNAFGILCCLGLLGFLQVHLDLDREEQQCVCVCVFWGRGGGLCLIDSLEPECSCTGWVTLPSCPLTPFFLLFLPGVPSPPPPPPPHSVSTP